MVTTEGIRQRKIHLSLIFKKQKFSGQKGMPEGGGEGHFRGRKVKDVQRRMITHLFAGSRKGFLEKMPYEKDSQRGGGDGTAHKRHGMSKNRKTEKGVTCSRNSR